MNLAWTVIVVLQVLSALAIIGLVLIQHGKGADMGAAFGSGASGSLFGATGSSNFLSKSTAVAAAVFFAATLALAFLGGHHTSTSGGVMENYSAPVPAAAPAPATSASNAPAAPEAPAAKQDKPAEQSNQIPK